MQRLAYYRDRGRFPLNEGQSHEPVPIFVDRHNTACAVGQLMRWSGWDDKVAEIARTNDLVYVPDAANTSVASWILTSGLTFEEAALIQPGYPFVVDFLVADYAPGGSILVRGDLQYSNLEIQTSNYKYDTASANFICNFIPDVCATPESLFQFNLLSPDLGGTIPDATNIGMTAGKGNYISVYPNAPLVPIGNNWIIIGGDYYSDQVFTEAVIDGLADANKAQQIVISFDVSTLNPDTVINQLSQHQSSSKQGAYLSGSGFPVPADSTSKYWLTTRLSTGDGEIASTRLDANTPFRVYPPPQIDLVGEQASTVDFAGQHNLHVETEIWLLNGVGFDSFALDFNATTVAEPAGLNSCLVGVALVLFATANVTRRRRK